LQSAQVWPIRTEHKHKGDENRSEKYGLIGFKDDTKLHLRANLAMMDQLNVSLLLMQRVYIRLLVHDPRSRQCHGALRKEIHHNDFV